MPYQGIPVINYATLGEAGTRRVLDSACRNWGVFQLVDHPIDPGMQAQLASVAGDFFRQSPQDKARIARTADNPWGYFDSEFTRQAPDWKEVYDYGPPAGEHLRPQWPAGLPEFRPTVSRYYAQCVQIAFTLLEAIALNLGARPEALTRCFRPQHTSFVRLNHYPRCAQPASPRGNEAASNGYLGVNPHTDAGALTLLLQDQQSGLEVFHGGQWRAIAGGTLIVNLGDILQVWSNDKYRAPLHRVAANPVAERFSAPFFLNPSYDTRYEPLAATVDGRHPPRYRPIEWGEFRRERTAGDYARRGEEIQISQFRL